MNNCYYEALGIPPSADLETIRAAYRSLAQRFHPDKNPDFNAATATMQQLNAAYRVLSNPIKRKKINCNTTHINFKTITIIDNISHKGDVVSIQKIVNRALINS